MWVCGWVVVAGVPLATPDQGQHVTPFHWLSVLPYANEAGASLQTLALASICIISTFWRGGRGEVGHERTSEREREGGNGKKK